MSGPIEAVTSLAEAGGFVMPWLMVGSLALWMAVGWRAIGLLSPGRRGSIAELVVHHRDLPTAWTPRSIRDLAVVQAVDLSRKRVCPPRAVFVEALSNLRGQLSSGRVLIRTLVVLAPLAGLLGTVTGMIETFRSLADMALFTQGGGIAGGIAEALLTTQMGLSVSVPGLLVGRALDRREARIQDDLDHLTDLLCGTPLSSVSVHADSSAELMEVAA